MFNKTFLHQKMQGTYFQFDWVFIYEQVKMTLNIK